jgi:hypothetical protein
MTSAIVGDVVSLGSVEGVNVAISDQRYRWLLP